MSYKNEGILPAGVINKLNKGSLKGERSSLVHEPVRLGGRVDRLPTSDEYGPRGRRGPVPGENPDGTPRPLRF